METAIKSPQCYFCGKEVTDDDYCYGCKHYVCDECESEQPSGNHNVEDHKEE